MEQIIGKLDREEKGNGSGERATTGSSAVGSGGQWRRCSETWDCICDNYLTAAAGPSMERAIDFGCNLELVLESWERASHYFNCSNFVISPLIETYQLQPGTRQLQLHFLSPWSWWKLPLCSSPAPSTLTLHLFSVVSCNCLAEIRRQKEG